MSTSDSPIVGAADFAAVLDRARAGSGQALRTIYQTLAPQVAGYLRARGTPDADAAANEVFHRAFTRLDRFSGTESGFRSWIFTIAHNLVIDEHRKRTRRPQEVGPVDARIHDTRGGDTEAEAMTNLATLDVAALLETLTPSQRDVLRLRVIAGLTLAETAEVLDRPVGAVKSLQHRAVEALRNRLQKRGVTRDGDDTFSEMT